MNGSTESVSVPINEEMKSFPLVSICIPTHNGEKYLEEALHSVLRQTYRPLELVISDDDSTDQTLQIIDRIFNHVGFECRVYQHTPEGMVQNWNYCVEQARGEFIKFLFQDDLLAPDCIVAMVALAQEDENIGMVFSRRGIIVEGNITRSRLTKKLITGSKDVHRGWTHLRSIQSGQELLSDPNLLHGNLNKIGEPSCVLLRQEVFSQIGGFNPSFCQLVDFECWLRIMMAYKIGFIGRELAQFRIHADQYSIHNHKIGEAGKDWKQFFPWLWTGPVKPYLHPKALRALQKKCVRLGVLPGTPKPLFYQCLDFLKQSYLDFF
jgi:glycosyltransferase involved in cell wall biosynthesis